MPMKVALIAAAAAGILAGAACSSQKPAEDPSSANIASTEHHACKGQNLCRGQGGCKTEQHACKGQNLCRGQGGCKVG